jgi:membrane protein DedA with SNARE-associated domain
MRAVGPAVIGAGTMPWLRFAILDALAALVWAVCWTAAGYVLGESVDKLLGAFTQIGRLLIVGIAVGTAIITLLLHRRRRKVRGRARHTDTERSHPPFAATQRSSNFESIGEENWRAEIKP